MKARLLLIPAILATTAAIADTQPTLTAEVQARAAQLPVAANARKQRNTSPVEPGKGDAHARVLGQHPAVLVSKNWSSRGIDPNTLILSHPALAPREKSQHAARDRLRGGRSSVR